MIINVGFLGCGPIITEEIPIVEAKGHGRDCQGIFDGVVSLTMGFWIPARAGHAPRLREFMCTAAREAPV
jgi:hypothetical protein